MTDVARIDPDDLPPDLQAIAERLADEGVPIRAMARSFKKPSENVRAAVGEGIYHGRIVHMPKDDWQLGQKREDRDQTFNRHLRMNDENLIASIIRVFKVTKLQGALLAALLNRNEVSKDTMHQIIESRRGPNRDETDIKMVDVVICNLRKRMKPHPFVVNTLWGYGYYMTAADRKSILEMVTQNGQSSEAPDPDADPTESETEGY
jgi:DNA-binding response OmpR family regulator